MYEFSIDYLRKLIAKSGLKMGIAKQAAMVAIIELIDENTLDGLIKSIQADYNRMKFELSQKDDAITERKNAIFSLTINAEQKEKEYRSKLETINALNIEIERLTEERDKKKMDMLCEGLLPEERSRLLAFDAAMKLMDERYGRRADADQIIRSASNVAANWRHEPEKACGKEINP